MNHQWIVQKETGNNLQSNTDDGDVAKNIVLKHYHLLR